MNYYTQAMFSTPPTKMTSNASETPKRSTPVALIPPPPPLRRVNAFTTAVYEPTDEDDLMDRLRTYRSELQLKQDDLYKGATTEEEVALLNDEYEKLSSKIHAIENLMLTCGAIFRTR